MKAINLIWIIPVVMILGSAIGFYGGINVSIPSDINISVESEGLDRFSKDLDAFADRFAEINNNRSCNYNVTMDEQFYIYAINNYKETQKAKRETPKLIDTFCKKPNTIGTLHLTEARELTYLELNYPLEVYGYHIEILGASDTQNNLILDINGNRKTMYEGDCFTNNEITVCVEELFVTTIPSLNAAGSFNIFENQRGHN